MSFIEPIFAWNVPLVCLIFLKRSLVFPLLLFSSISFHCSVKKALSLLAILCNPAFRWVYLYGSPLPFPSFLSLGICKPPPTTALPPCLSFSLGWLWSFPSIQYYKPLSIVLWAFCLHCHASLLYFFLAQFTACYLNYQKYLYRLLPFWNSYSSLDF